MLIFVVPNLPPSLLSSFGLGKSKELQEVIARSAH